MDLASSYLLLIVFEGAAEGCASLLLILYSILREETRRGRESVCLVRPYLFQSGT